MRLPVWAPALIVVGLLAVGCWGGIGGAVLPKALPILADFVGDWVVSGTPDLGIVVEEVGESGKALVKQFVDGSLVDVGHGLLADSSDVLEIVFTSVKNNDQVYGQMKKVADSLATLVITNLDSTEGTWDLVLGSLPDSL